MSRPRLLDLYSCAGGAAMGYHRAGFDIVGVDINPQPRYPFEHVVADALEYLDAHGSEFDAVHASPPCQRYTIATKASGDPDDHPDLLAPTRDALDALGRPYIIENVPGAPMRDYVTLCGSHFGLVAQDPDAAGGAVQLRRHRQFESNVWITPPGRCHHRRDMVTASVVGDGGAWKSSRDPGYAGGYVPAITVCAALLGVDWMTKREMSECIPPAYTEHLGRQLIMML